MLPVHAVDDGFQRGPPPPLIGSYVQVGDVGNAVAVHRRGQFVAAHGYVPYPHLLCAEGETVQEEHHNGCGSCQSDAFAPALGGVVVSVVAPAQCRTDAEHGLGHNYQPEHQHEHLHHGVVARYEVGLSGHVAQQHQDQCRRHEPQQPLPYRQPLTEISVVDIYVGQEREQYEEYEAAFYHGCQCSLFVSVPHGSSSAVGAVVCRHIALSRLSSQSGAYAQRSFRAAVRSRPAGLRLSFRC